MKRIVFTEPIHKVQHEGLQGIFAHIGCIERPTNGDDPRAYQVFTKKHRKTSVDILLRDVKTYIKTLDT